MNGHFIVIEGLEGAGKSTAVQTVVDWARQHLGQDVVQTREPGGTPLAEKMRDLVKQGHPDEQMTDQAELLLIYAARAQLVERVIRPALAEGKTVVGDRHDLSSQAYQGGGRGFDSEQMTQIRHIAIGDFKPDLTLFLDIDPALGLQRAARRGALDRIEQQQLDFFQRARQVFQQAAQSDPKVKQVDASQPLEQVQEAIKSALAQHFGVA